MLNEFEMFLRDISNFVTCVFLGYKSVSGPGYFLLVVNLLLKLAMNV